uniref:PX domain-containing protein n=1 Tax=Hucho hucho TaxID=62062 RepID=A0A4W5K8C1_9TELE
REVLSANLFSSLLQAFNIHVNSVLHCQVRYSQLLGLHQQIKKEYGNNVVPAFPPKKIFTLTPAEVEQRREQLEKYMQAGEITFFSAGPCI